MSLSLIRRTALHSCAAAALLALCAPIAARAQEQSYSFNIPAQALAPALNAFGRQSRQQVVFDGGAFGDRKSSPVVGSYTANQAINALLAGTGFSARMGSRGEFVVAKASGSGTADPTPERTGNVDEVIVTAQKREENLKNVPISMTVLSGRSLDSSTITGLTSVLNDLPGVVAAPAQFGGGTQIAIRGVTASKPVFNGASPIAYYIDSVPFSFVSSAITPDLNAYDLSQVEVLRGPQGTLYGASAQNGVVRVLTHEADLNTVEFKARSTLSGTEYGGMNEGVDAAFNLPLIQDKLAVRFVAGYAHDSGWIDRIDKPDANSDNLVNLRFKLNAQPIPNLSVGLSVWHSESDYKAIAKGTSVTFDPAHDDEPLHTGFDTYGLRLSYNFPGVTLTSSTSYLTYKQNFLQEVPPYGQLTNKFPARTFAQEIYLNSDSQGPWRWTAGLAYRDSKDTLDQSIPVIFPPDPTTETSRSIAVFGQLTRTLFDKKLEITAGFRYFHDNVIQLELGPNYTNPDGTPTNTNVNFTRLSPKFSITWRTTDQLTTYASYSQGFRSGFTQSTLLYSVPGLAPARPDNLNNYEVGAKGNLGNRISFDAAAYYIHWTDVQTSTIFPIPGTNLANNAILNGKSASGPGAEGNFKVLLLDGLTAGANVSWNNLTQDENVYFLNFVQFPKGSRLNYSPEITAGLSLGYVKAFADDRYKFRATAQGNYISRQKLTVFTNNEIIIQPMPSTIDAQLNLSVEAKDGWAATLFVNNLGRSKGQPLGPPFYVPGGAYERPRTIGLQLEYHY